MTNIVMLHKECLGMTWSRYTEEAHKAMANLYIPDERFKEYYDREIPGCASFPESIMRFKLCPVQAEELKQYKLNMQEALFYR